MRNEGGRALRAEVVEEVEQKRVSYKRNGDDSVDKELGTVMAEGDVDCI